MSGRNSFVFCNTFSEIIKRKYHHKPSNGMVGKPTHMNLVLFLPVDCIEEPFTNIKLWEITNSDVTIFGSRIVDSNPSSGSLWMHIMIHCHKTNDIVDFKFLSHVNTFRPRLHYPYWRSLNNNAMLYVLWPHTPTHFVARSPKRTSTSLHCLPIYPTHTRILAVQLYACQMAV